MEAGKTSGEWEFTLLLDENIGRPDSLPWTSPGCAGAFVGSKDESFAVLSNDRHSVMIYDTKAVQGGVPPRITLRLPGTALTLFGVPSFAR